jgi:hypothetical protein
MSEEILTMRRMTMRLPIRCLTIAACVAGLSGAALGEQVDNPVYTAWAQYKPGTSVSYKQTTTVEIPNAGSHASEMTITQKLVEVKPDGVTVEGSTTMSMNGREMQMPASTQVIRAKVEKDQVGVPQFSKAGDTQATVKDVKLGTDTVDVKGTATAAKTREMTVEMTAPQQMTMHIKSWGVEGIPGGLVKMESTGEGAMTMHSTMMLLDYHVEK